MNQRNLKAALQHQQTSRNPARSGWVVLYSLIAVTIAWGISVPAAHAWSGKGHAKIAEAAFAELTPAQQRYYASLLSNNKISTAQTSPAVHMGILAKWPDQVRQLTLQQMFTLYGSGRVPRALASWSGTTTKEWHYENALLIDGQGRLIEAQPASGQTSRSCPPRRNGKLFEIWPKLLAAYRQVQDPLDRVLVISLLLHFSGDAHQPLHTAAALKPGCRHDGGGNGFCVAPGPARFTDRNQRCSTNLHRAWDTGFGVFNKGFSPAPWRQELRVADLESVVTDHRRWMADVYPNADRTFESPEYQTRARTIVITAASRAVGFQTLLLKHLARG